MGTLISRGVRRALGGAAAVLLVLAGTLAGVRAADRTVTVLSWGGAYADSQAKAYFAPYRQMVPEIDFDVVNVSGNPVEELRKQVAAGAVTADLVDVNAADAIRLCKEGLVLPIDHDRLLRKAPDGTLPSEDFGQTIVSECFIPEIVYSTVVGYRTDAFKAPPTRLCDLFDLARFPGRRALERRPINNLEWALLCDGVPIDQVYATLETEDGLARAFRKLDSIKTDTVWWTDGAEPATLLAENKVVIASAYNGRLFRLETDPAHKAPVATLWDWQAFDFDGWVIPKQAQHLNDVLNFLRFATDTQRLADQAKYISYGPARRSSMELVGTSADLGIDMKPYLPTAPENAKTTLIYNYDWWAQHRDALDTRFRAWLGS